MEHSKKILFARSGGGTSGLDIHAGITSALDEEGIRATHNCGVSAGAAIGAMDSCGHSAQAIVQIIRNLTDDDVRHERPFWKLRAPFIRWFLNNDKILNILFRVLSGKNFLELNKPLRVWTTDCISGEPQIFGIGAEAEPASLQLAVLASMAIRGIFPSVGINHGIFSDGGTNANLPLPLDFWQYDEVWFLIATPPTQYRDRDGIIQNLLLNLSWMMEAQIRRTLEHASAMVALNKKNKTKIFVVRPTCGTESSMLRFDHSLIDKARQEALAQISKHKEYRV